MSGSPAPTLYTNGSQGAPAPSHAEEHSKTSFTLLASLPVELVHEILRIGADDCGATNRSTVDSISRTCRLGYTLAIPFLYRVFVVDFSDYTMLYARMFEEQSVFADGVLSVPAVRRLCPLVQHLVLRTPDSLSPLNADRFNHFTSLSSIIVNYPRPAVILPRDIRGPTHVHYGDRCPRILPPSVTHVSITIALNVMNEIDLGEFRDLDEEDNWSPTVTHVSLEFSERIRYAYQLTGLLDSFLRLPNIEQVVVRLFTGALHPRSQVMTLRGIYDAEDRSRVRLWADNRWFDEDGAVIDTMVADAYAGCTPWTKAWALTDEELAPAASLSLDYLIFGAYESDYSEDDDNDDDEDLSEDEK